MTEEEYKNKKESFLNSFKPDGNTSEKEILAYPFTYGKQEIDDVFPLKKYKFEDAEFLGPNNYDPLLASEYRDYMSLPPEEDRKPHYTSIKYF
jgi:lipopolysaccharide cholinephosphotransferase